MKTLILLFGLSALACSCTPRAPFYTDFTFDGGDSDSDSDMDSDGDADAGDQVVEITGGGHCGWWAVCGNSIAGPFNGNCTGILALEYIL